MRIVNNGIFYKGWESVMVYYSGGGAKSFSGNFMLEIWFVLYVCISI